MVGQEFPYQAVIRGHFGQPSGLFEFFVFSTLKTCKGHFSGKLLIGKLMNETPGYRKLTGKHAALAM